MYKKFYLKSLLLLLALIVGSGSAWADQIEFDFEDESAHRTDGTNSYTSNTYQENGVSISLTYADAVTSGSPLAGSANVMGRIAKNTTNSPVILIGPINNSGNKITTIYYTIKGVGAMKMVAEYSNDNSTWHPLQTTSSMPTTKTVKTVSNLSITDNTIYLRFTVSVTSSTSSNRDFQLDDIIVNYETNGSTNPSLTTTTEIDASGITNTDVYTSTSAGSLSATVSAGGNAISGASVSWSSSNTDVATIDENGAVTLVSAGTTTITASYAGVTDQYQASSATYEMTVTNSDPNVPGTQNNPYTVAQAIDATPSTGSTGNVYIHGIVSSFYKTSIMDDGSNYRYYISDDGTTETELLVYKGKDKNQNAFDNENDLLVGDEVIIYGKLTTYNNAPEVAADNYIVSQFRKELNYITLSGNYPTTFVEGSEFSHERIVVTAHYNDDSTKDVTENAAFSEPDMTQIGEQDVTVSFNGKSVNYTITITEAPSHTATFSVNGEVVSTASVKEGFAIEFPTEVDAPEGYAFTGWVAAPIAGTQATAPEYVTSATMGESDVTFYAVFANVTPGTATTTTDVLNRETTGVTGTSYSDWSGKTVTSDAVYAGNSAGDKESIQLRSKNSNSGIVTTTSGGNAKKVTVVWNSNTESGRTLDIYGKNTAYEAATDLYNNDSGTKLGSIVCGTSTELTITDDYPFIGLRSNSGAMYLTSISIDWQTGTPDTYSNYCTTIPELTINIASACTDGKDNYYGTFYSDKAYIMDEMLEGQVVSVDADGKLVVKTAYEGGDVVPAKTALLIYAVEPRSYNVYTTTAPGKNWSEYNMLKGTLTADEMTTGDNCLFYRLTMHNGTQIGFWWGADYGGAFKPGANKAYLAVPAANGSKIQGFTFGNDGDATEIVLNALKGEQNGEMYNLQGQKVGSEYKGIVIVNGKKFINK